MADSNVNKVIVNRYGKYISRHTLPEVQLTSAAYSCDLECQSSPVVVCKQRYSSFANPTIKMIILLQLMNSA